MSINSTNFIPLAACMVDTVPGAPVFVGARLGFTTAIVDNGVGDVTLELADRNPIDLTNADYQATCLGSAALFAVVDPTAPGDRLIRVRIFNAAAAGAAADGSFCLKVNRKAVG